ncbi:MAG: hypothetical protein QCI82_01490 [Candidatus Thermoplasmatota archaeon]|nr:hypothetical protein [Candidatus Thermoplasmatota archaeon]
MKRWQLYRGVEDPISGTFNLAEEIIDNSDRILFLSKFALYFVWFSVVLYLLLFLATLSSGNWFLVLILLSLLVTGIITARLLTHLRRFLKTAAFRYSAIKAMREGPPGHSIPKGKNMTERFLNYLKKNNLTFKRMISRRPEIIRKDSYAVGKSGKRHHFSAFILNKASFFSKLFRIGYPGYSIFIREYRRSPSSEDLKAIISDLEDITSRSKIYPGRVCLLYKAGGSFNGIDEKLYDKLVEGRIYLKAKKEKRMNVQVVVELPNGRYEFIPYVPELPKVLP